MKKLFSALVFVVVLSCCSMVCFAEDSPSVVSSPAASSVASSASGAGRDDVIISSGDLDGAGDVVDGVKSALSSFSDNMPSLNSNLLSFYAVMQSLFPGVAFFWTIVFLGIIFSVVLSLVRFGWHFGG